MRNRHTGFNLIELMVAVAVVGILAGVAYPAYTRHVTKSNRAAAESFMFSLANREEQYLLDNRQYTNDADALLGTPSDVSRYYSISITTGTAPPTYTITATPSGSQSTGDAACGTLTLTQNGTKGISGSSTVTACW